MAETSETFVVKPTLFMILMSEKETSNILKIYFQFSDLEFCSLALESESVVVTNHDFRNRKAVLETDKGNGLVEHTMLGEAAVLPNEEVRELFHTLWTKATRSEDYDKKQWMKLSEILTRRGFQV
jgi:hypothetical protein